jgi:hypothetical protein
MVSLLAVSKLSPSVLDLLRKQCPSGKPPNKCADLPPARYSEYGWPALGTSIPLLPQRCVTRRDGELGQGILAPPLWLTVIGNDGFWPLAILDSERYAQYDGAPDSLLHAIQGIPKLAPLKSANYEPWELLCLVFIVIAVVYTYLRWAGSIFASTKFAANFAPVGDSYCSYGLLITDAMLFIVLFLLLSPWLYSQFDFGDRLLGITLWLVFALLLVSAIADQFRRRSNGLAFMSLVLAFGLGMAIKLLLDDVHESSRSIFFTASCTLPPAYPH